MIGSSKQGGRSREIHEQVTESIESRKRKSEGAREIDVGERRRERWWEAGRERERDGIS
jgi:hypothetical protein